MTKKGFYIKQKINHLDTKITAVGSWQLAVGSWQLAGYFIKPENTPMMYKIQATDIPLQAYLSAVGMTGRTAYFGLNRIGKPQKDGTLVVSTASGAVGGL